MQRKGYFKKKKKDFCTKSNNTKVLISEEKHEGWWTICNSSYLKPSQKIIPKERDSTIPLESYTSLFVNREMPPRMHEVADKNVSFDKLENISVSLDIFKENNQSKKFRMFKEGMKLNNSSSWRTYTNRD